MRLRPVDLVDHGREGGRLRGARRSRDPLHRNGRGRRGGGNPGRCSTRKRSRSDKIADFYEDEVDTSIQALTSIVEPLLMLGVGAIVGVIVIAMYVPMAKLLQLVQ
jgi:hypothetical protein